MHRKTEALINLDAIRNNYSLASALAPQSKHIAVIKADAYGHGMLRVAEALQDVVPAFAVAILEEALELRAAGISQPILVLEGVNDVQGCEAAAANELSLVVHSQEQVSQLLGDCEPVVTMCLSSARTWRVPTILRAMRRSNNSILSKPASRELIFQPALVTQPVFSPGLRVMLTGTDRVTCCTAARQ